MIRVLLVFNSFLANFYKSAHNYYLPIPPLLRIIPINLPSTHHHPYPHDHPHLRHCRRCVGGADSLRRHESTLPLNLPRPRRCALTWRLRPDSWPRGRRGQIWRDLALDSDRVSCGPWKSICRHRVPRAIYVRETKRFNLSEPEQNTILFYCFEYYSNEMFNKLVLERSGG